MQRLVTSSIRDDAGAHRRESSRMAAIGLMCAATGMFALLDTTAKYLIVHSGLPFPQIVWLRITSQLVLMLAILGLVALPRLMRPVRPGHQLLRSLAFLGSTLFNYIALQYLRLDQTVTVSFLMPLLVALLAGPLLGEWVGWRRMVAIGVGFLGILVVVRPGLGSVHPAIAFSMLGTLCYALYALSTRYLAAYDATDVTLFWSLLVAFAMLSPIAMIDWVWPTGAFTWGLIVLLGAFGGFGHYLLILAHRALPASSLAPFTYLGLIWVTGTGYLVFGDLPDLWTLVGSLIIIGSGLYLLHRERVRAAEAKAARQGAQG